MTKYRYSILTYIINNYEKVHEIENKKDDVEYILVTDTKEIVSETWEVKYVENPYPNDPFWLCYDIRFNPFKYVSSDIVLRIDGSMGICGDTDLLIDKFEKEQFDMAVSIHPTRNNMYDEYLAWVNCRKYPLSQAEYVLNWMIRTFRYDVKEYKGLYQYNICIQRNSKMCNSLNELTLANLKFLAEEGKQIERIYQTIVSMILNIYFSDKKIMTISDEICNNQIFYWCTHGTDKKMRGCPTHIEPYLFNKPCKLDF